MRARTDRGAEHDGTEVGMTNDTTLWNSVRQAAPSQIDLMPCRFMLFTRQVCNLFRRTLFGPQIRNLISALASALETACDAVTMLRCQLWV
jgi:hypothetical protein